MNFGKLMGMIVVLLLILKLVACSSSPVLAAPPIQGPVIDPTLQAQAKQLLADGLKLDEQGDHQGALAKMNQALMLFRRAHDRRGEAITLYDIGTAYSELEQSSLAIEYFSQALPIDRELGDRALEGETLEATGDEYDHLDERPQALPFYQQALAIYRAANDKEGQGRTLLRSSEGLLELGRFRDALDSADQALGLWRALGDRKQEGISLERITSVYYSEGRYAQAIDYAQQALAVAQEIKDSGHAADALGLLGLAFSDLGQYDKAIPFLQQSVTIFKQEGEPTAELKSLGNLAFVLGRQGKNEDALIYYQQALDLIQRLPQPDPSLQAGMLMNIGGIYDDLNRPDQALASFQEALPISQQLGDRQSEAGTYMNIGSAHEHLGQPDQALGFLQQALSIFRDIEDLHGQALSLGHIGDIYQRKGDFQTALSYLDQMIAIDEKVRSAAGLEEFKTSLGSKFAGDYEQAAYMRMRIGRADRAFDLSEQARARTFLDQIANSNIDLLKGADAVLLAQEQDQRPQIAALEQRLVQERSKPADRRDAAMIQSLSDELAVKEKDYTDLLTRIKLSNPEYASLVTAEPADLHQVQAALDDQTTLLSFLVTQDRTLAFVVTRNSFKSFELAVSAKQLNDTITGLRRFADLSDPSPAPFQDLYQTLIAPVKDELKTPILGIIPYGVLHYLPFASLYDGKKYLGDEYILFTLPSASALPFIKQKRKGEDKTLLAVAQAQPEGLPALRYADQEASNVARLFNSQPLTGSSATVAAISAQAGNVNILHIAAHGELNTANPLFTRIVLAPDKGSDGSLRVQDVYSLNLTNTDLVVLSACQTLLGAQSQGDDVVGLTRAFIYAGSPSVIASLWSVDDQATSVLMTSFYMHLQQGMGKATALQAAQAETRAKYPNPYYWAAFVLTGDPGTPGTLSSAPSSQTNSNATQPTAAPNQPSRALGILLMAGGFGGILCVIGFAAMILALFLVWKLRAGAL